MTSQFGLTIGRVAPIKANATQRARTASKRPSRLSAASAASAVLDRVPSACEHLVDTPPIQIDDFEPPAACVDLVADAGNRSEFLEQKAGTGLIRPRGGKRNAELFGEFERRHPARYEIGPVVAPDEGWLRRTCLGVERADNRFQNVRARDDALKDAVLVVDEPGMDRRVAQDCDHIACIDGFRDDRRL